MTLKWPFCHENWCKGCKIDLITHPKLGTAIAFTSFFSSIFDMFINVHEYANEITFI